MKKFEYKAIKINDPFRDQPIADELNTVIKELNKYGKKGWCCVNLEYQNRRDYEIVLMREIG